MAHGSACFEGRSPKNKNSLSIPEKDVMVAAQDIPATTLQHQSTGIPDQVTVRLAEIYQALADAAQQDRAWLHDFLDDEVTISRDLHQILARYEVIRRAA